MQLLLGFACSPNYNRPGLNRFPQQRQLAPGEVVVVACLAPGAAEDFFDVYYGSLGTGDNITERFHGVGVRTVGCVRINCSAYVVARLPCCCAYPGERFRSEILPRDRPRPGPRRRRRARGVGRPGDGRCAAPRPGPTVTAMVRGMGVPTAVAVAVVLRGDHRGSTVARLNNDRPQLCGIPIDGGRDAHCY